MHLMPTSNSTATRALCWPSLTLACLAPFVQAQRVTELGPPLWGGTILFDGSRNRMVLNSGKIWELANDTWVSTTADGGSTAIIYHSGRQRLMTASHEFDGKSWVRFPVVAKPSPSRSGSALAYDHHRDRVVLFGGARTSTWWLGDTWEFDGRTWANRTPSVSPPKQDLAQLVYDPDRRRTILAGADGTWEWDGTTWTKTNATLTSYPGWPMAYDPVRKRVLRFERTKTWSYNGKDWVQLAVTQSPPLRSHASLGYDPIGQRILLGSSDAKPAMDLWELPSTSRAWRVLETGLTPGIRNLFGMSYDPGDERVLLHGGTGSGTHADLWQLQGERWQKLVSKTTPPVRYFHAQAFDRTRGRLVVFGGEDANQRRLLSTWEYTGSDWVRRTTTNRPSARNGAMMVFDSFRRRMVLFGGDYITAKSDTWAYDGKDWRQLKPATSPPPRSRGGMAFDAGRGVAVLFGGGGNRNDTWEFDGTTWREVKTTTTPTGRYDCTLTYDPVRGRSVLLGGSSSSSSVPGTIWEFDGRNWSEIKVQSEAGYGHQSVYDESRGRILSYGGLKRANLSSYHPALEAAWSTYGLGCAGSAGVPRLTATSPPKLGGTLRLELSTLPSTGGPVYLAMGFSIQRWQNQTLPVELDRLGFKGCRLWGAADQPFGLLTNQSNGRLILSLRIPALSAIRGLQFVQQAIVGDPAASNGNGAASNAGIGTIY